MTYRKNIPRPTHLIGTQADTEEWTDWANSERLIPSVAPAVDPVCGLCFGAVGPLSEGGYFPFCVHCRHYRQALTGVVPIVYSMPDGLESLLHDYKDGGNAHTWMGTALGSLLSEFMRFHLECLTATYGLPDRTVTVPPGEDKRTFDPLRNAIQRVKSWPVEWDFNAVRKVKAGRPPRGEMDIDFYALNKGVDVTGETILVVDDTWTSGSTIASVAGMLRASGAKKVVAVTAGRQLKSNFGSSDELISTAHGRVFNPKACVICRA